MQIERRGSLITSPDLWFEVAPPKGGREHWVVGRSARELAHAWCGSSGPCVPPEVDALLRSHADLADVMMGRVLPEHRIRFDDVAGEPRNADLAIEARDRHGALAITVEGKADEPFDRLVRDILETAVYHIASDQRTGAVTRVQNLAAMLPAWREDLPHLGDLRYQLLTGIAGTLAWARDIDAGRAVFVVHEFVGDLNAKHERNASDLNAFVRRLTDGRFTEVPVGKLIGPIGISEQHGFSAIPLYVGKARRSIRAAA